MKIVVIGPVYPFRGGIPHSSTLLCENLHKNHDLTAISFKRLYPKFLFPGRSQKYNSGKKLGFRTDFIIDSVNFFNWVKTFLYIRKIDPQLVILQWWTLFLFPFSYSLLFLLRYFTKIKVCIITANVLQHEEKFIDRYLTKLVFKKAHYFVALTDGDLKKLKRLLPKAKAKVLLEPTFDSIFSLNKIDKEKVRKRFGLGKNVILFFGFVREYKGLKYLLQAMPLVLSKLDVDLIIAGEFWEDKTKYLNLMRRLKIEKNVKIFDKYLPDEEVGMYFCVSDVVVMPYISGSQSGIIQLAFGANKPVIVSNTESIADLIKHDKNGLIVEPSDSKALADAIIEFFQGKKAKKYGEFIRKDKKKFQWGKDKEKILFHGL